MAKDAMNVRMRVSARTGARTWQVRVMYNGRSKSRTMDWDPHTKDHGRRRADDVAHLLREELQREEQQFVEPSRQLTGEFLREWLPQYMVRKDRSPKTQADYQGLIERHIIPAVGHVPLDRLAPHMVQRIWDGLGKAGHAPTARYARAVLHVALQDAFKRGLVLQNVVDRTEAPSVPPVRPVEPYTLEEVRRLIEAATPRWRPMLTLMALTGLRREEACGLQWGDWDTKAETLAIHRTITDSNGAVLIQDRPKTRAGYRTLTLPQAAQEALRQQHRWMAEQRLQAGIRWQDGNWIFSTAEGNYLHPRNVSHAYSQARKRANLRHQTLHGLRHHNVSALIAQGVSLAVISKREGHSSVRVTADIYGHLFREPDQDAARRLDEWWAGSSTDGRPVDPTSGN